MVEEGIPVTAHPLLVRSFQDLEAKLAEAEKALDVERARVGVLRKPLQKIMDNPRMSPMRTWEMAEKALKATEKEVEL